MEKETLKNIFEFLEENEGHKTPFLWKLLNNEPFTDEELIFKGDLDLRPGRVDYTVIESLPDGLKVDGNLDLSDTEIRTLPKGLEVGKFLDLRNCTSLTSLPQGLKVGVALDLQNCANLTSLPKGLEVGYDLFINRTTLTKYTNAQLRKMIKPGFIKGKINR